MSEEDDEWHEIDQISVRKSLKEVIDRLPEDKYDQRVNALEQLRSMVMDEIAKGFYLSVTHALQTKPKDTLQDAKAIIERLGPDMDRLGLAISHPDTNEPMRLTLAQTPPSESESWFQLEPMTAGSGTHAVRLERPLPFLKLCEAPTASQTQGRGGPRR